MLKCENKNNTQNEKMNIVISSHIIKDSIVMRYLCIQSFKHFIIISKENHKIIVELLKLIKNEYEQKRKTIKKSLYNLC